MQKLQNRKKNRMEKYDYSTPGAYFITVCVDGRKPILWEVGAAICRQPVSKIGAVVEMAIQQISQHYPMITVDKYCIMPDHIHILLFIDAYDENRRQIAAPTVSTVVGHMKRWVSVKLGYSIWQKSFFDRVIRNEKDYRLVWEYIENNPAKLDTGYDVPKFDESK